MMFFPLVNFVIRQTNIFTIDLGSLCYFFLKFFLLYECAYLIVDDIIIFNRILNLYGIKAFIAQSYTTFITVNFSNKPPFWFFQFFQHHAEESCF